MDHSHLREKFDLTTADVNFITCSRTEQKNDINQSRIISEMYLSKTIDTNVDKIIESNKKLSKSNDNHSRWMAILTVALVFVAAVQLGIKIYDMF